MPKSLRFSVPRVVLACERLHMCPRIFDDIEVLAAKKIIPDWMKMGAAKKFARTVSPQALPIVLDKLTVDAFSQPGSLFLNLYFIPNTPVQKNV